jgi:hypothetical protein
VYAMAVQVSCSSVLSWGLRCVRCTFLFVLWVRFCFAS